MGERYWDPVSEFASEVSAIADENSDCTAGVVIEEASVVLYLTDRGDDVHAAVKELDNPYAVPVRVVKVRHSSSELDAVMRRLTADAESLDRQGIVMTQFGPAIGLNRIEISLLEYTDEAAETLYVAYGADLIVVSTSSLPPARLASRPPAATPEPVDPARSATAVI